MDISLLLEYYDADNWVPALHVADRVGDPKTHHGILEVCWWSVKSKPTSLFFGDEALFPLNTGLPDDLSPTMQGFVWPNFKDDQTFAGWILLSDIDLSSWHHETVIVGGPVKAQYASFFGDGKQPPPISELLENGISEPVLERVTNWKNERKHNFQTVPSYKAYQLSPDFLVQVTWIESLVEYVGHIWVDGLAGLVDIESPERYRIVAKIG